MEVRAFFLFGGGGQLVQDDSLNHAVYNLLQFQTSHHREGNKARPQGTTLSTVTQCFSKCFNIGLWHLHEPGELKPPSGRKGDSVAVKGPVKFRS